MIDEGSFSDTEHPFKQMMRDRYLEKKGFTILRLRSNDIAPDRVVNGREVIKLVEEALPKA
jgi:very-short-patch-repair endonuclease